MIFPTFTTCYGVSQGTLSKRLVFYSSLIVRTAKSSILRRMLILGTKMLIFRKCLYDSVWMSCLCFMICLCLLSLFWLSPWFLFSLRCRFVLLLRDCCCDYDNGYQYHSVIPLFSILIEFASWCYSGVWLLWLLCIPSHARGTSASPCGKNVWVFFPDNQCPNCSPKTRLSVTRGMSNLTPPLKITARHE